MSVVHTYRLNPQYGYRDRNGDPIAIGIPLQSGLMFTGEGEYLGLTVRETSGVNGATLTIIDSETGSGSTLEELHLLPMESVGMDYTQPGRLMTQGLWTTINGSIEGSAFILPHLSDQSSGDNILCGLSLAFAGSPLAPQESFDVLDALSATGTGQFSVCDNALKDVLDNCPYLVQVN